MVSLEKMGIEEFRRFMEEIAESYSKANIEVGKWEADVALKKAEEELALLLPDGIETKDQHLFEIRNQTNIHVGSLWVGQTSVGHAWIYQLSVLPQFRRSGYGTNALAQLEVLLRKNGIKNIGLHVFGNNRNAFEIYENSGYKVQGYLLGKEI